MSILSRIFGPSSDNPGVYRIRNKKIGAVYIGSTARIMRLRWDEHRIALRRRCHSNKVLQADWDRHGERAFEFAVVEVVDDPGMIPSREAYWQTYYQSVGSCYSEIRVNPSPSESRKKIRRYGISIPADIDPQRTDLSTDEILRMLALATDIDNMYAYSPETIARFLRDELSERDVLHRIMFLRAP